MPPENPQPVEVPRNQPAQNPGEARDKVLVETIRTKWRDLEAILKINDIPDNWETIVNEVTDRVPEPNVRASRVPLATLRAQYDQLNARREAVLINYGAIMGARPEQQTESYKDTIRRATAMYLQELALYKRELGIPAPLGVPPSLAKYVELSARERAVFNVTRRMVRMQYDIQDDLNRRGFNVPSPRTLAPLTTEIALRAIHRRNVTVADLRACLANNPANAAEALLAKCELRNPSEDDKNAARLLSGYVLKYETRLRAVLPQARKASVDELTVGQALEYLHDGGLGEFAEEYVRMIREKGVSAIYDPPDITALMDRLSDEGRDAGENARLLISPQAAELVFGPLLPPEVRNDPEKLATTVARTLSYARGEGKDVQLRSVETAMDPRFEAEKALVLAIKRDFMKQETVTDLLKASFLPEGLTGDDLKLRQEAEKIIRELVLEGNLTVRETMDLYFWLKAPVSGQLLAAGKIISIVGRRNFDVGNRMQVHLTGKLEDIITSGEDMENVLNRMGLTDEQKREMRNVARYMQEEGVDRAISVTNKIYHFLGRHPWLIPILFPGLALLAARGAVGAARGTMSLVSVTRANGSWRGNYFRMGDLTGFMNLRGEALQKFLADHNITGVDASMVALAQEEARTLHQEIQALRARDRWWRSRPYYAQSKVLSEGVVLMRAARSGELNQLADALKTRYPTANLLAARLGPVAQTYADLEAALVHAGHTQDVARAAVQDVMKQDRAVMEQAVELRRNHLRVLAEELYFTHNVRTSEDVRRIMNAAGYDAADIEYTVGQHGQIAREETRNRTPASRIPGPAPTATNDIVARVGEFRTRMEEDVRTNTRPNPRRR